MSDHSTLVEPMTLDEARIGLAFQQKLIAQQAAEIARLQTLVVNGLAVVEDFMPNVGHCALQHYDWLNQFCVGASNIKRALAAKEPT